MRAILIALLCLGGALFAKPQAVYLTWTSDPTTSMVVQWITGEAERATTISFRSKGSQEWTSAVGSCLLREHLGLHAVALECLSGEYEFKIGNESKVYTFRTAPTAGQLKFAIGGDAFQGMSAKPFRAMNRQVANHDPEFVVLGGDLAYVRGTRLLSASPQEECSRWVEFFQEWERQMVGKDGRLIPMLVAVGNHDVPKNRADPAKRDVFFYDFFCFPQKNVAFRALDFPSNLSLVFLDTDHTYPIVGPQTRWLQKALEARKERFVIPIYHVAAYPSYYSFEGKVPTSIRQNWVPLFERCGVRVAFEHHNHTYKRTCALKEGKRDASGITYLGDGAWGVPPRAPHQAWYLEKAAQVNCFYFVTWERGELRVEARDVQGRLIEPPLISIK